MAAIHPHLDTAADFDDPGDEVANGTTVAFDPAIVDDLMPRMSWALDVFVVTAILLVATAAGVALIAEAGLPTAIAFIGAGALLVTLLATHVVVRRSEALADMRLAIARSEAALVDTATPVLDAPGTPAAATSVNRDALAEPKPSEPVAPISDAKETAAKPATSASNTNPAAAGAEADGAEEITPKPEGKRQGDDRAAARSHEMTPEPPSLVAPPRPPAPPMPPAPPRLDAAAVPAMAAPTPPAAPSPLPPAPPAPSVAERMARVLPRTVAAPQGEEQQIRQVLDRLAADIATPAGDEVGDDQEADAETRTSEEELATRLTSSDFDFAEAFGAPASADDLSDAPTGETDAPIAVVETGEPAVHADGRLAAIAAALSQENVDLFLEPIKSLEDVGAPHFEVSVQLRLDSGEACARDDYAATARGTPLMPLIDVVSASKTRSVARRLMQHEGDGRIFTPMSGDALQASQTKHDFGAIFGADRPAAERMILSFPQSDTRSLSADQSSVLSDLKALGFQFALDHLTDLEMDFDALNEAGFVFVKIDADVFLDGLQVGMTRVPADDICRHFGSLGLTPIVGHIRDVTQLQRLRACGVTFGQGPLLGTPRLLKPEWLAGAS